MNSVPLDVRTEFAQDCDQAIAALRSMICTCDQNGHLLMMTHDIWRLTSAVELLVRAKWYMKDARPR